MIQWLGADDDGEWMGGHKKNLWNSGGDYSIFEVYNARH